MLTQYWKEIGAVGLFLLGITYNWLTARKKKNGKFEYKWGEVESDREPNLLVRLFRHFHTSRGSSVDIEEKPDGFEATVNDVLGQETHFEVKKKK